MRELGRRFLDEYVPAHCKASTAAEYRRSVELFVEPRIGRRPVPDIQRSDIAALHHDMQATPYQANRTLGVLSKMFNLAELSGCRLSEIQKLRWEHVALDAGELRLPDTKTGAKIVHLGDPAMRKPGSHLTDLQHPWRRIRARAGLADVRAPQLRQRRPAGRRGPAHDRQAARPHLRSRPPPATPISPTIPSRPPQTASQAESPTSQGDGNHIEA